MTTTGRYGADSTASAESAAGVSTGRATDHAAASTVEIESLHLPRRTTPTWEIELLISGALVFSLFQAIAPLDHLFARWIGSLRPEFEPLLVYGVIYAKLVVFIMIGTFVGHLVLRAYWVSLVGVHSIYPHGVLWDRLQGSAIAKRVAREQIVPMPEAIERADNRASLLFALGVLCAQFSVLILMWTLAAFFIAWLLALAVPALKAHAVLICLGVFGVLGLGLFGIDKLWASKLPPEHAAARRLGRFYRWTGKWMGTTLISPLFPLLSTNVAKRGGAWVITALIYVGLAAVMVHTLAGRTDFRPLLGDSLPTLERDGGVHPLHYRDQRHGDLLWSTNPWIPSWFVEGPYLPLFVPFVADRHNTPIKQCALPSRAPGDASDATPEADRLRAYETAWAQCFGALLELRIEGQNALKLSFDRQRDGATGLDGVLAMIDVRTLPAGRHELVLRRFPTTESAFGNLVTHSEEVQYDRIEFWR